jgi:hypothetical protein
MAARRPPTGPWSSPSINRSRPTSCPCSRIAAHSILCRRPASSSSREPCAHSRDASTPSNRRIPESNSTGEDHVGVAALPKPRRELGGVAVASILDQAREAAGDRDVRIAGGSDRNRSTTGALPEVDTARRVSIPTVRTCAIASATGPRPGHAGESRARLTSPHRALMAHVLLGSRRRPTITTNGPSNASSKARSGPRRALAGPPQSGLRHALRLRNGPPAGEESGHD